MKKWLINIVTFHFIPLSFAFVLTFVILFCFNKTLLSKEVITKEIKGLQLMLRGTNANCVGGDQAEIEMAGSLKNPSSITIFGSSELGAFAYSPYYFLPDSLQMPTVAFGHAYHQSFAMFCELLAFQKNIKNSKICIMISPGWFETEGTNIEAFLEFVRPNFLKSIIHNNTIPFSYKLKIGKYISSNFNEIEQPSQSINYFNRLYTTRSFSLINRINNKLNAGDEKINYNVKIAKNTLAPPSKINWNTIKKRVQIFFTDSIKTNSIFVSDQYYTTYLLDENKKYNQAKIGDMDIPNNKEFDDFKLLVQLLKKYNCDASFVIQPLNVYHYKNLENYNEIMDSIEEVLEKNNFPFLNMFVTKKEDFEPGTLNDIMHLGDYGWMKVNEFLVKTYNTKR